MRRFLARVALVCAVTAGVLIPAQAAFAQFSDVPTTYWDYTQITYVAETNLWMQDYGPTVFNPTTKETRSLLCSALVKAYAPDQPIDPTITFPDLPTSDPYYPYANVCVKNDWIEPFNDGRWAGGSATPKSLVDRAIVLAMGNLDDAVAGLQNIHRLNGAKYTWANERGPYMQMAAWLGLHFDHSGSDEKLDLLSSTNMKRDEVAYTLWAAKTTTSWMISDAHMFDDITLGNDSASNKVNMIQYAIDQIGYPYIWAGEWNTKSPAGYCCGTQDQGGFDCSGFTWWVEKRYEENYNAAQYHPNYSGWNLHERSSYDMAAATAPKDQRTYGELQVGNLMFFASNGGGASGVDHVAVYAGNNWMIHSNDGGPQLEWVGDGWWYDHFVYGRPLRGATGSPEAPHPTDVFAGEAPVGPTRSRPSA